LLTGPCHAPGVNGPTRPPNSGLQVPSPRSPRGSGRKELVLLTNPTPRRTISALLPLSAVGAGLLVPAATFAAEPSTCPATHWPASVHGMPTNLHPAARGGDYLWHNSNGWHLRVTHHGSRKVVFTGRIVSPTPITGIGV